MPVSLAAGAEGGARVGRERFEKIVQLPTMVLLQMVPARPWESHQSRLDQESPAEQRATFAASLSRLAVK